MNRLADAIFYGMAFAFIAGLAALAVATTVSSLQIDPLILGIGALVEVALAVALIVVSSVREARARTSNKRVHLNG